jgi:hypothetical protein
VKDPAVTPPVSRKRDCPPGSCNKKTLEALAAAAAVESARVASAAVAVATAAGAVATADVTTTAPTGAAASTALAVVPTQAATAVLGAAIAVGAALPGFAGASAGGSTIAAATVARKPRRPPLEQRLSYTLQHGFTTFVVHLRAGCEVRLPLPFKFVDTLGGNPLTGAIVEEGSGVQPLYPIEILHDD